MAFRFFKITKNKNEKAVYPFSSAECKTEKSSRILDIKSINE